MGRCPLEATVAVFAVLALTALPTAATAEPPVASVWEPATLVHLLTPALADSLRVELTPHFDVLDGGEVILLAQSGNLFNLSRRQYMAKAPLGVTTFALSAGVLVTIRDRQLGWYQDGAIQDRIELPLAGLQVVAGPRARLYFYGSHGDGSVVYLLEDGKVLPLLEVEKGVISALAAIGERVFFALDNAIYTVAKGERAGLVFVAAGEKTIRSLAADPNAGVLYFSAGETVFSMRAGVAVSILRGLAGFLRHSKEALYVLDPERRRLVRVLGLEKLTAEAATTRPPAAPGAFKE